MPRFSPARWLIAGAIGLISLAGAGLTAVRGAARIAEPPVALGLRDGRLAPCPASPNCISSQADPQDAVHYFPPMPLDGDPAAAQAALKELVLAMPRIELLSEGPGYLHFLARSATFGFPDDVEFALDPAAGLIHLRSASRMGQGDLGVNRARMEQISAALSQVTR